MNKSTHVFTISRAIIKLDAMNNGKAIQYNAPPGAAYPSRMDVVASDATPNEKLQNAGVNGWEQYQRINLILACLTILTINATMSIAHMMMARPAGMVVTGHIVAANRQEKPSPMIPRTMPK
ncbi:hypothetical protein JJO56_16595 [Dickeya chrysanthemi]|nr:hypothetical protein [Dickeya chrysanthemi]